MPAFVKSSVGSSAGTSEEDATRVWPFSSKKDRNVSRTLRATLEKRARALPAELTRQARSKKLFDHLVRRGFAPAAVLEALHRKGDATDDES